LKLLFGAGQDEVDIGCHCLLECAAIVLVSSNIPIVVIFIAEISSFCIILTILDYLLYDMKILVFSSTRFDMLCFVVYYVSVALVLYFEIAKLRNA
jgi:hypothetical protein